MKTPYEEPTKKSSYLAWKILLDFFGGRGFRNKTFIYFLLFSIVLMSVVIVLFDRPQPIEAFPLALVGTIAVSCIIGALLGLVYQNYESASHTGQHLYNKSSLETQIDLRQYAEDGYTNGTFDVSDEVWEELQSIVQSDFGSDTGGPPVTYDMFETGLRSPWEPEYMYIYPRTGTNPVMVNEIDETTFNYLQEFGVDELAWLDSGKYIDYQVYTTYGDTAIWYTYFNGRRMTYWSNNGNVYNEVFFNEIETGDPYYFSMNATSIDVDINSPPPKFVLIADTTDQEVCPFVVYQRASDDAYILRPFCADINGNWYSADMWDYQVAQMTDDTIVIHDLVDDDNWDIVIEGHRYVPFTDEFGHVIGLAPEQILNEEWNEGYVDSVVIGLEGINEKLEGGLTYWNIQTQKLSDLDAWSDQFEFSETGELKVTMEGAQSGQYDLDIPQTDWDFPILELASTKFPFSIPFDLYYAVSGLVATPEAPVITVEFEEEIFYADASWEWDFSDFEGLATVVRWVVLVGFIIGLILVTRKLIRG